MGALLASQTFYKPKTVSSLFLFIVQNCIMFVCSCTTKESSDRPDGGFCALLRGSVSVATTNKRLRLFSVR